MTYSLRTIACLLGILTWPVTCVAVIECRSPDRSFKSFYQRFTENMAFQQSRIVFPLVYRFGDYTMTTPVVELWDMAKLKAFDHPLILSHSQRKIERINEAFLLVTRRYSEAFQDRPETDDYRMLYKFRNVGGCWFLEEAHDKAL